MVAASPRGPRRRTFREGGATITLVRSPAGHVELRIGDVPILTSRLLGTERAFGRIVSPASRQVVVGGLGFGATLAGVLETVGADAQVTVVERLATVIDLVRGELAALAHGALDDPRVTLVRDDVRAVIARSRGVDAILLDVDNGPDWGSFRSNAALYDRAGLAAAHRALRVEGRFAVWSGYPADAFLGRLRAAGFRATTVPFTERGRLQARAYVGTRRAAAPTVEFTR